MRGFQSGLARVPQEVPAAADRPPPGARGQCRWSSDQAPDGATPSWLGVSRFTGGSKIYVSLRIIVWNEHRIR
jgi:hypothetical protein